MMQMSAERPMKGLVVPHRRDYANWRLRAFRETRDNHPIDPAWELGQYMACHEDLRKKVQNEFGSYRHVIFDCVWDRRTKAMVIRSAFEISKVKGKRLIYDEFWFCDGVPRKSPSPHMMRTQYGKELEREQTLHLLNEIKSSRAYVRYKAPARKPPKSISSADWNSMIRAARKARSC
jgi:hypothetical protein